MPGLFLGRAGFRRKPGQAQARASLAVTVSGYMLTSTKDEYARQISQGRCKPRKGTEVQDTWRVGIPYFERAAGVRYLPIFSLLLGICPLRLNSTLLCSSRACAERNQRSVDRGTAWLQRQVCREPRPRLGIAGASFAAKGCRIGWKVLAPAEWRDNRSRLRCGCTSSTAWLSAYQIQEAMTCLKYDADHRPDSSVIL